MTESLQRLVDELASVLHRSVAIDDPGVQLVVASGHEEEIDSVRARAVLTRRTDAAIIDYLDSFGLHRAKGLVRVPANAQFAMLARVAMPLRFEGRLFGYLWLIEGSRPITPSEEQLVVSAGTEAAGLLAESVSRAELETQWAQRLVRSLVAGDKASSAAALAEAGERGALSGRGPLRVIVRIPRAPVTSGRDQLAALLSQARFLHPLTAVVDEEIVTVTDRYPSAEAALATLRRGHRTTLGGHATVDTAISLPEAYRRARFAVRVAAVGRSGLHEAAPTDRDWADLGAWQLLIGTPWTLPAAAQLHPGIDQLFEPAQPELVDTLLSYLEHGGDATAAARALHIHRTTLYHRLHRINSLIGTSWSEGWERVGIHAALMVARIVRRRQQLATNHAEAGNGELGSTYTWP